MIAIICSQCGEGVLGFDEESCSFQSTESIQSKHFFKLTPEGWTATKICERIECPKCKSGAIIADIIKIWNEERDKRRKG